MSFLTKKEFNKIFEFIDPNQLEKKYGGNLPDLAEFWFITKKNFLKLKIICTQASKTYPNSKIPQREKPETK